MKFADLKFEKRSAFPYFDTQATHKFPNGWEVSVTTGEGAYGGLELAVLRDDDLHYDNPVARGDVRGWLTEADVDALLAEVEAFSSDVATVEAM